MLLFRAFARKLKPVTFDDPVMKEIENYLNEQQKKGIDLDFLRKEIITDASLSKLQKTLNEGRKINPKTLNIRLPVELESRITSAIQNLPDIDKNPKNS
jgi:hypothetical protein